MSKCKSIIKMAILTLDANDKICNLEKSFDLFFQVKIGLAYQFQ